MCEALAPGTICSSNGICVNESICVCTVEGFTTLGDLRYEPGLDCDCFTPAILALWILVIVFSLCACCISATQLVSPLIRVGIRSTLTQSVKRVQLGAVFSSAGFLILGIWRVSDINSTQIGVNVGITYFSILVGLNFSYFALYMQYEFFQI